MDLNLKGRVALVTGASSGIGKAVALSLAREGVTLALAARRTDELQRIAEQAKSYGAAHAAGFFYDQTDPLNAEALYEKVEARLGPVDILVANGGGPKAGTFLQTDLNAWDTAYSGTLRSMLQLVYRAVPSMQKRSWGRIVALTSMTVKEPIPTLVLSNALRVALVSALKTLSMEIAADGITVNSIATGRIATDRLVELYDNDEAAMHEAAQRDVPMRRVGTPEEFAPLISFLCSEKATYITGQTIAIDGGFIKSVF